MSTGPRCRELGLCEPVGNREDGYARQRELLMGMMELTEEGNICWGEQTADRFYICGVVVVVVVTSLVDRQ